MVGQGARSPWASAAVELLPERGTHRHRAVGPVKGHALLGQPVDIRGLTVLVAVYSPAVTVHVICQQENDIGPLFSGDHRLKAGNGRQKEVGNSYHNELYASLADVLLTYIVYLRLISLHPVTEYPISLYESLPELVIFAANNRH